MMDEYEAMCRDSPVQKEWKPKQTDSHVSLYLDIGQDFHKYLTGLPRQEDWQRIYRRKIRSEGWKDEDNPDVDAIESLVEMFMNGKVYHSPILDDNINRCTHTMLWCLFVHKEVWNLTWDWEKKEWVKE